MKPTLIVAACTCALTLLCYKVHAQFTVDTKIEDLYKVNIINPGISLEKKIIQYSTVQLNIFWNATINAVKNKNIDKNQYLIFLDPTINIQYRYYHNYYKRADKGKIVDYNGANFIGGILERTVTRLPFKDNILSEKARPVLKLGAVYGIQRNIFKYLILESYVGGGYLWETKGFHTSDLNNATFKNGAFAIFGQLNIGIPVL